jgi:hypothetical protein
MDRKETAKIVSVMVAATAQGAKLGGKAVEAMVDAYTALLTDIDYARCNAAVRVLLQAQTWIPSVADIRRTVLELERGPGRFAGDAWGELRMLQKYQVREAMEFVDPIVLHICQAYKWIEWRTLWRNGEDIAQWHVVLGEHEPSDRARFIELYDKLTSQERREQQVPLLAVARDARERGQLSSAGDLVAGLLQAATAKKGDD